LSNVCPVAPRSRACVASLETYAGIGCMKGGLAGRRSDGCYWPVPTALKAGSIWYPINLLAATVYAESLKLRTRPIEFVSCGQFRDRLVCTGSDPSSWAALCAMLPMFARRPIVLGGLIAPVLWSGLLYSDYAATQSFACKPP